MVIQYLYFFVFINMVDININLVTDYEWTFEQ